MPVTSRDRTGRDADRLAAVIDAQRAAQRSAEARLHQLWEMRESLQARGADHAQTQMDALDLDIAAVTARVKDAIRAQAELMTQIRPATN